MLYRTKRDEIGPRLIGDVNTENLQSLFVSSVAAMVFLPAEQTAAPDTNLGLLTRCENKMKISKKSAKL